MEAYDGVEESDVGTVMWASATEGGRGLEGAMGADAFLSTTQHTRASYCPPSLGNDLSMLHCWPCLLLPGERNKEVYYSQVCSCGFFFSWKLCSIR